MQLFFILCDRYLWHNCWTSVLLAFIPKDQFTSKPSGWLQSEAQAQMYSTMPQRHKIQNTTHVRESLCGTARPVCEHKTARTCNTSQLLTSRTSRNTRP
uniref:Putative secreted protein n=1 Tax=Ixodes ricinus TaxID=34613 RepID=A0A6B0UE64_IXORI